MKNYAPMNMKQYTHPFNFLTSIIFWIYIKHNYWVIRLYCDKILEESYIVFHTYLPFYIPTRAGQRFQFLQTLPTNAISFFVIFVISSFFFRVIPLQFWKIITLWLWYGFFKWLMILVILPCQLSPVQLLSHVRLFVTPWTTAYQASLSITKSWSLLRLIATEIVMPSNHVIPCRPLLPLPTIFSSVRVFPNESVLHIRWPKYWSFSFNVSPSNDYSGLFPLGMTGWISLLCKGLSRVTTSTNWKIKTIWLSQ